MHTRNVADNHCQIMFYVWVRVRHQRVVPLIAWIIDWIGHHGWNDCARLIAVAIAFAALLVALAAVAYLVGA
jgi:hypothetical protein